MPPYLSRFFLLFATIAPLGCATTPAHSDLPVDSGIAHPGEDAATPTAEDAAIPPIPSCSYVAIGDSFTIGTGSSPAEAFPARLVDRWNRATPAAEGCALTNLAVNGYSTGDLLAREIPALPKIAPRWMSLAIGANDLVRGGTETSYRDGLKRIFSELTRYGMPPNHLFVIPQPEWPRSPTGKTFGDAAANLAAVKRFNGILAEETAIFGGKYIDLGARMTAQADADAWAPDGLHPNAASHDAWAGDLAVALASLSASSRRNAGSEDTLGN